MNETIATFLPSLAIKETLRDLFFFHTFKDKECDFYSPQRRLLFHLIRKIGVQSS
ncbi:MAG: hypothetical protein ACI9FN_002242 [Saprospiraceae bacterium]|jgi:hypothetical protein